MWYREVIGHNRCPIVDTWWQTETGHIMLTPDSGRDRYQTRLGHAPVSRSRSRDRHHGWQARARRFGRLSRPQAALAGHAAHHLWRSGPLREQYWSQIPGTYFTGDGARKDKDGYFWVMGRVDDVINVSGHRLSTMEVESALVAHQAVAEAAVVGRPDDIKGQAISAFVTLQAGKEAHAMN